MIRVLAVCGVLVVVGVQQIIAQEKEKEKQSSNLRQYYSGKFGFYQPSKELNNGLLFGVDGITEFIHYDFTLTGAIDFYQKQTISVYQNPNGRVTQQAIVLIPLHASVGYKLLDVPDADTRFYAGVGGGYNLFFYNVEYVATSGGLFGPVGTTRTESKNSGNVFFTAFLRVLIGRVFVEPRLYIASAKSEALGGGTYTVDPSGFAITLGFQYQ
ncbi:MAG TPA: hypothetical protein VNN76_08480 [Bacteroidota bacterium]|nr:hypothetical protein [Bacteroidota bacterium]